MLAFSATFPVNSTNPHQILELANEWISGSPHYTLKEKLTPHIKESNYVVKNCNESFECISANIRNFDYCGVRFVASSDGEQWTTEIVARESNDHVLCSIRVHVQAKINDYRHISVKKPYIFNLIEKNIGFFSDGAYKLQSEPFYFNSNQTKMAADIINGSVKCKMPFVYISKPFYDEYQLDPKLTAKILSGLAHVVVEPSIYFSLDLKKLTNGKNPYHGAVGIFIPNSEYSYKVLSPESGKKISVRKIFEHIIDILSLGLSEEDLKYSELKNEIFSQDYSKAEKDNLDNKSLLEIALNENEEKEREIEKLNGQLAQLRSVSLKNTQPHQNAQCSIKFNSNIEIYPDHVHDLLLELIQRHKNDYENGTKPRQIIDNILSTNQISPTKKEIAENLKNILRGYTHLTSGMKKSLNKLGIKTERDGGHHKVYFAGHEEFISIISVSASDKRTGLNCASDIINKNFF